MGHGRDLTKLGLVEGRIGDDRADGGVGHKLIFYHLIALIDLVLGTKEGFFILCQKSGNLLTIFPVINISQSVDRHNGSHLQFSDLYRVASDPRLHTELRSVKLSHSGSGPGTEIPVPVIALFRILTGRIAHSLVRPDPVISHHQIEQAGFAHQGNLCDPHIEADIPLLQILHYASGRIQPKGAASGQQHRMDRLCRRCGLQELRFPGRRTASPDIQPRCHALLTEDHRAAGGGVFVFCASDLYVFQLLDLYFFHLGDSFPSE